MGVDHGLGGKDGAKSKSRRAKRAKKTKAIAQKALTGGKKKEVIFDEKSRFEYLTGFHKRKQERRKYGLALEVLKKQKAHKELIKEQRNAYKQRLEHADPLLKAQGNDREEEDDDTDSTGDAEGLGYNFGKFDTKKAVDGDTVQFYEDPSTLSMFGSVVSVVVDDNLNNVGSSGSNNVKYNDEEEDEDIKSIISLKKSQQQQRREPTRMEKALKKAKLQLSKQGKRKDNSKNSKAAAGGKKKFQKKAEGAKLLSKALGRPIKASNRSRKPSGGGGR